MLKIWLTRGSRIRIRAKSLAVLIAVIALSGCAAVVIHPITPNEIKEMPENVAFTPVKHGYFVSDFYISEVMKARIDKVEK